MRVPLELTIKDVDNKVQMGELVRRKADKLDRFCDHIIACRVSVERPHRFENSGNPFRVRIDVTVPPGHEIVVRKEPSDNQFNENLSTVINNAFQAMERRLKKLGQLQRGEVKHHDIPRAIIVRLLRSEGYGFIKTLEGQEVYFHKNSLVGTSFDQLLEGMEVRFEETMGQEGPQATTVQVLSTPGKRPKERVEFSPTGWE